jgi:hypothetical protein
MLVTTIHHFWDRDASDKKNSKKVEISPSIPDL